MASWRSTSSIFADGPAYLIEEDRIALADRRGGFATGSPIDHPAPRFSPADGQRRGGRKETRQPIQFQDSFNAARLFAHPGMPARKTTSCWPWFRIATC